MRETDWVMEHMTRKTATMCMAIIIVPLAVGTVCAEYAILFEIKLLVSLLLTIFGSRLIIETGKYIRTW